jgi:hypothetical protein
MLKFYLETSALEYFISYMRGIDAQATHELQNSKNREWYISTTTLWELMQIRDFNDYDHALFLASLLVEKKIFKSPSEIILDLINPYDDSKERKTIFSNSKIAQYWEHTCNDKSYSFNIADTLLMEMTKKMKNISKNIPYIIGLNENSNDENIKSIRKTIEYFYNVQFKDKVSEQIRHLRKISILSCFLLICCGYDITYDIVEDFWNEKNISDIFERYTYLTTMDTNIITQGPLWFIANLIYSQTHQTGKNSRGSFHDGFHIVNILFVDIFLTNDNHFLEMKNRVNKEMYDIFYKKIYHMSELKLIEKAWKITPLINQ